MATIWNAWRASWAGLERAAKGKVRRHFNELRNQTLKRLHEAMGDEIKTFGPGETRSLIGEVLFDIVKANNNLIAKVGPLILESTRLGGEQAKREAADAQGAEDVDEFNLDDPEAIRAMRRRQLKLTKVNRTLQKRISATLSEGLENADTLDEIAERLRKQFKIASSRANTIARTEIGAAVEEGRQVGRKQAGTPLKSWLWSRKETGRPSHAATERATMSSPIQNDEQFTIAGTSVTCMRPRASGDPAHDINCGCTTLSRYPDDQLKEVADRYLRRDFLTYERMLEVVEQRQASEVSS